ncbi:MAG TPA: DUF4340 domain-containing protein, partial [Verrucomicrobiota bacterium]|nr:DUF4340 domain-containing protein [Verrucomicrobiota bacterium]
MNKKTTLIWVLIAVGLFAYIYFFEQPHKVQTTGTFERLIPDFKPELVNELRITKGKIYLRIQKLDNSWWLTGPIKYPAHPVLIENLLKQIGNITCQERIETRSLKEFGLEEPVSTILVKQKNVQYELQIGNVTPIATGVYVRIAGGDAVYVAPVELRQIIPDSINDWRSRALVFSQKESRFDRLEVNSPTRGIGFAIQYNPTNRIWRIIKPLQARADNTKIDKLLMAILSCRVTDFVTDNPNEDLAKYGIATPELELVLGIGTNDLINIQFGKSPTNDPAQVYARILNHKNIVLVNREIFDKLHISFTELRDRRLLSFDPKTITEISVRGVGPFTVQYQSNQIWRIIEPQEMIADNGFLSLIVTDLLSMQAKEFEKDVVTDFTPYGLAQPLRQIIIKSIITNQDVVTNIVVAALDFGTNGAGKFFARRPDESSVYEISELDYYKLPEAGWQLRSRQIWNINISNVVSITVSKGDSMYQILRRGDRDWILGSGSQGIINKVGVERAISRLCALQANSWIARGVENRSKYGFTNDGYKITLNARVDGQV